MLNQQRDELYSESEVAELLGITLEQLYRLLDAHIFNDGSVRPANLTFTKSELLLLEFWQRGEPAGKLLRMPRRP